MRKKQIGIILAVVMLACVMLIGTLSVSAAEINMKQKLASGVCDSYETEGGLMARQGKITDKATNTVSDTEGRTIIPITKEQLDTIENKIVVVATDGYQEFEVSLDCAYTWFYNWDVSEQKLVKINAEDMNYAAFLIIDNNGNSGTITGFGYYRLYQDSKDNFMFDAMYRDPSIKYAKIPTAEDLTYNGTEQTGVAAGTGYTLEGTTKAKDAGNYSATAKLADGYIWSDGTTGNKTIDWSIARKQVTVTAENTDKLVGSDDDPDFEAYADGLIGGDEIVYSVECKDKSEEVGTYEIVVTGEKIQGNYEVEYVNGTFEIRAGEITVNGKGYDDIAEALNKFNQDGGEAVFNGDYEWNEINIKEGAKLKYDKDEWSLTVDGDITMSKVTSEEIGDISVNGTLTLNGDLYADEDFEANVYAKKVVLGDDVTVGDTDGEETDEIVTLKFDEIDVNGHKLTLTANGIVKSANTLNIATVFEVQDGFKITETAIDGGYEYGLTPAEPISITVNADGDNISSVNYDGNPVSGELMLPESTTQVELTLEANSGLTIPVYFVSYDDGATWTVTTKTASYTVEPGDRLTFKAVEAVDTNPGDVSDDQIKQALIDAVDSEDEDVHNLAVAKIIAIVGYDENKVSARSLAEYIINNGITSENIADCNYVIASVKLGTDSLIDEEESVVTFEFDNAFEDRISAKISINGEVNIANGANLNGILVIMASMDGENYNSSVGAIEYPDDAVVAFGAVEGATGYKLFIRNDAGDSYIGSEPLSVAPKTTTVIIHPYIDDVSEKHANLEVTLYSTDYSYNQIGYTDENGDAVFSDVPVDAQYGVIYYDYSSAASSYIYGEGNFTVPDSSTAQTFDVKGMKI